MSAHQFRDDARALLRRRLHGLIKSPAMFRDLEAARLRHQVSVADAQRAIAELMREPESGNPAASDGPLPPLFASNAGGAECAPH